MILKRTILFVFHILLFNQVFYGQVTNSGTRVEYLNEREFIGEYHIDTGLTERPDIYLITVDMISPDVYLSSRELSQYVNTPNLDSLARNGVRFDKTFCTAPICGPSRSSILTGKHQVYLTNGERAPMGMVRDLQEEDIIFPQYLKKSGYTLKHVGKWHVGKEKFVSTYGEGQHGWDRWAPPLDDDELYLTFLKSKNVLPQVYSKEINGKQYDRVTAGNSLGGWIEQENGKPFPLEAHYSVFLAELAIDKLESAKKTHPDQPVFLQLEFFDPHQPYSIPSGLEGRYEELKKVVKLPVSYEKLLRSDFKSDPSESDIYRVYRQYWGLYEEEVLRDYIIGHLLQMEVVDHALGKFFSYLKKNSLWDNSVIMFTADHGDMNGRMAMADKGVYFQPDIFRIPLYLKPPDETDIANQEIEQSTSSLDIAPTLLEYAGIAKPGYMEGESLVPVAQGRKRTPLYHVFQTGWHVGVNYGFGYQFRIKNRHWFYGYNISSGIQELYDIDADDQVNQFYNPDMEGIRIEIIKKVAEIMQADKRWLGYWATFRLHNAAYLPIAQDDMQMFKPKDKE